MSAVLSSPTAPEPDPETVSEDDVARTVRVLDALVQDNTQLAALPRELRVALLMAAGRLSRPHRGRRG